MTIDILRIAGLFAILQTINVILQTVRTLSLARTNNVHINAGLSAVAFGFYVVVVNQIANTPIEITIPLTLITNMLGTYISCYIFKKFQKDELWKIEIFTPCANDREKLEKALKTGKVSAKYEEDFTIAYCYTRTDSDLVKTTIKELTYQKHNIQKFSKF